MQLYQLWSRVSKSFYIDKKHSNAPDYDHYSRIFGRFWSIWDSWSWGTITLTIFWNEWPIFKHCPRDNFQVNLLIFHFILMKPMLILMIRRKNCINSQFTLSFGTFWKCLQKVQLPTLILSYKKCSAEFRGVFGLIFSLKIRRIHFHWT